MKLFAVTSDHNGSHAVKLRSKRYSITLTSYEMMVNGREVAVMVGVFSSAGHAETLRPPTGDLNSCTMPDKLASII